MSRAERLLTLLESLRRRRYAVSGNTLARELGVSLRTVYRDIAALQAQGAPIEGEAGVGFVLRPGYFLPPMVFSAEEIEAIALGARWVVDRGDERLAMAARDALSKVKSVLPLALRDKLERGTLLVPTQSRAAVEDNLVVSIRSTINEESVVDLRYRDLKGNVTERTIWPFALAYYDQALIVIAWCELRQDFRHFRADRIETWGMAQRKYPKNRMTLLREWQTKEGIPLHKYDL
jgi:predicted DNA-binding transcriptional regulator YafY